MRPAASLHFSTSNPPQLAVLNEEDSAAYLERLELPSSLLHEPPSLSLLASILLAHHLQVPYDTSSLHVTNKSWNGPSVPIKLGKGIVDGIGGMDLGTRGNLERITRQHRGGFCYSLNTAAAALLRGFGFRVSEVGTRVYLHRGKDPVEVGYLWSSITHELLVVDWPESQGQRWMVDVGFGGGGCPRPIRLVDGAVSGSLSATESFLLKAEDLPIGTIPTIFDPAPGFTLYRRVCPPGTTVADPEDVTLAEGQYWSPCVHFTLQTLLPEDIAMSSYYNETHPKAPFVNFFVVSRLLPSGARRTLSYGPPPVDMENGNEAEAAATQKAKLYTKEGIRGEEMNVEWISFDTESVRKVLAREFQFKFDESQ